MRAPAILLTALAGFVLTAEAQVPGKEYLIGGFERQKGVLLRYVDAMPDSAWRFKPTPGVRDYAQQLEHIAQATAGLTGQLLATRPTPASLPSADRYLSDRQAMREFMAGSFDAAIAAVQAMTDQDLLEDKQMFGITRAGWQWVIGIQEHSAWTLGATVPYLRVNGVTPPSYLPF